MPPGIAPPEFLVTGQDFWPLASISGYWPGISTSVFARELFLPVPTDDKMSVSALTCTYHPRSFQNQRSETCKYPCPSVFACLVQHQSCRLIQSIKLRIPGDSGLWIFWLQQVPLSCVDRTPTFLHLCSSVSQLSSSSQIDMRSLIHSSIPRWCW